jgi:hypothetical protein
VLHRLQRRVVVGVPVGRAAVQLGNACGLEPVQILLENVGEEVMVAVPFAVVVQRDNKQLVVLDPLTSRVARS